MIERANVEQMKSSELLRLARVLKLPILDRKIARVSLIDMIMEEIDLRKKQTVPRDGLKSPAIRIEGLSKRFGKKVAVRDLNLEVHPGEIVGLVGPNGAGKTTTLRILTGIIKPTSGSVEVNGHDILDEPILAKSSIGYIPERPTCYPSLTVREYITFMARIYDY